jgi:hypothetical protein
MIVQERVGASRAPWSDRDDLDDDNHQAQRLPTVHDDGKPNPISYECPGSGALDYETDWYCLPDVPDALVCTHCHARHLDRTNLERFFQPTLRTGGHCSLGTPRVLRSLLPAARQTGSLQELRVYLGRRGAIADCQGARGASSEHKTKWFRLARNEIEGFIVCEACHEDVIQATPFGAPAFFITYGAIQPVGQTWSCALCVPYARRALLKFAGRPGGWDEWINTTARRFRLPPCAGGTAVEPTSREWVRARHPIRNQTNNENENPIVFCEACYLDKLALTALDHDFEFLTPAKPQQQGKSPSPTKQARRWVCGTTTPSLTMALTTAIRRKEFGVFRHVADAVVSSSASPPCTPAASQGAVGGGGITTWYTLAGEGCDGFRVCPGCYAGAFEILGLGHLLQLESKHHQQRQEQRMKQAAVPGGNAQGWSGGSSMDMTAICSFNPAHPRYEQYLARLAEAVNLGVWSRFSAYVRRWASVLPCPRGELVAGRHWYGYGDLTVCPECWGTFCSPSPRRSDSYHAHYSSHSSSSYASSSTTTSPTTSSSSASVLSSSSSSYSVLSPLSVPLRNELIAKSRMCCMYSPRMRAKWREACVRGDPTELVEFSRLRMAIYGHTVLQIKTLRHLQQEESSKAQAGRGGRGQTKGLGGEIGAGSDLATNMKIIQLSQKWADVE